MRRYTNEEIIAHGLVGKIKLKKELPLQVELPKPPSGLAPEVVKKYNEIGKELVESKILKQIDGRQLVILAQALIEHEKVERQLDQEGLVLVIEKTQASQKGTITTKTYKKNPLFETYMSLGRLIDKMLSNFAMNPLSRNRYLKSNENNQQ
jgi:P27 family predicted phage terminase small subunit